MYCYKFQVCIRRLESLPLEYKIFRVSLTRGDQISSTNSFLAWDGEAEPNENLDLYCAFGTLPNESLQVADSILQRPAAMLFLSI